MDSGYEQPVAVELESHKCAQCGGEQVYDGQSHMLICKSCNHKSAPELKLVGQSIAEVELELNQDESEIPAWGTKTIQIKCPNCGGSPRFDVLMGADFCEFCGSSLVFYDSEIEGQKESPAGVIPFKVDQKQAHGLLNTWIRKRFFAPTALKKEAKTAQPTGYYVPFLTFDAQAETYYHASVGEYYYVPVTRQITENGETRTVTTMEQRTRWFHVADEFEHFYDDVPEYASNHMDAKFVSGFSFEQQELLPYEKALLTGWKAEKRSITKAQAWLKATQDIKADMHDRISQILRRLPRVDVVGSIDFEPNFSKLQHKLILVPLWRSDYTFQDKKFSACINAQTGEIQGQAPTSKVKVALTIAAAVAIAALIVYFVTR